MYLKYSCLSLSSDYLDYVSSDYFQSSNICFNFLRASFGQCQLMLGARFGTLSAVVWGGCASLLYLPSKWNKDCGMVRNRLPERFKSRNLSILRKSLGKSSSPISLFLRYNWVKLTKLVIAWGMVLNRLLEMSNNVSLVRSVTAVGMPSRMLLYSNSFSKRD